MYCLLQISSIFWNIMPYSPLKVTRCFGGTCRLHHQGQKISQARNHHESMWETRVLRFACLLCFPPAFTLVSCLDYSSTLKVEATCSSEMSVDCKRITWRYIPEDRSLYDHRCENLKSCFSFVKLHILSTCYSYLFLTILRVNSQRFLKQNWPIYLRNGDAGFFQWGRNRMYKNHLDDFESSECQCQLHIRVMNEQGSVETWLYNLASVVREIQVPNCMLS
jgi:hypothetical protein